jgi:hypothetical protein
MRLSFYTPVIFLTHTLLLVFRINNYHFPLALAEVLAGKKPTGFVAFGVADVFPCISAVKYHGDGFIVGHFETAAVAH